MPTLSTTAGSKANEKVRHHVLSDFIASDDVLYGACDGFFGPFDDKAVWHVVAVGRDWIEVYRDDRMRVTCAWATADKIDAATADRWRKGAT